MESQIRGGTRWKRFAVVMVPSVAATAAIGVGLAQGALAASFAVSGQEFKVKAAHLEGTGFAQYGGVDMGYAEIKEGDRVVPRPVAISTFRKATITKMCQSVVTPNVPVLGKVTLRLEAGPGPEESRKVHATNLYLDVTELDADATFTNIDIGMAAKDTDSTVNPKLGKGPAVKDTNINRNGFAQQAESAVLTNVEQKAWATTAGTFRLSGLSMGLHRGDGPGVECY
ncbi:DUF6230 family protein [Streptomyces sudanensis]|uniref:DUF6230 family protein n=1 Tax=Streptomyces sudanensis TaxID=436397 RepID=UPI0020CD7BE5|nr:DUF6230 family protein [Streptomyces sudanensis]MCP9957213.1 DUF6230 family protein [Streptomyces sudanensis]MCP9986368.1 DUF6230 family protein [Streptomyces sudanensis]MCQ0002224.1 DUF6230 family protein [Streptomyces sudanensis]